jgi:hypothetical protein
MITYNELYVLNRALDGTDIWQVPSFDGISDKLRVISEAKQSLINKAFLEDSITLTEKGVRLVRLLDWYKSADTYFNYQNVWAAILGDGNAVVLVEAARDDYELSYLTAKSILEHISGCFPFLSCEGNTMDVESRTVRPDELFSMYFIEAKSGFLVEGTDYSRRTTSCLFFELNSQSYRYDNRTHELAGTNAQNIIDELSGLLKIQKTGGDMS